MITKQLKNIVLIIVLMLAYDAGKAQTSFDIYKAFKQVTSGVTVLYVAAHPDDENTRLLAWLANEKKYRTAYLSLTRGDGGQNLIGDEQGVDLGIIRAQELYAARRIDGAEQYFTRAFDFGYSKTLDETLKLWDTTALLDDMVSLIRKLKPQVIITRFPKDNRAGHGHHSASAYLAEKAYYLAQDANYQPKADLHGGGKEPWKANVLLWNAFRFGGNNTTNENMLKIDIGTYIPEMGKSIGEIAAESRSQHKSQGFGVPNQRGSIIEYFDTWAGSLVNNYFVNEDLIFQKTFANKKFQKLITNADKAFKQNNLKLFAQNLLDLKKAVANDNKLQHISDKLDKIILQAYGVHSEVLVPKTALAATDTITATVNTVQRLPFVPIKLISIQFIDGLGNQTDTLVLPKQLPNNELITTKWFLQYKKYNDKNEVVETPKTMLSIVESIGDFAERFAAITYSINGLEIKDKVLIENKKVDPVLGEILQPLHIIPAETSAPIKAVTLAQSNTAIQTVFYKHKGKAKKEIVNLSLNQYIEIQKEPQLILPELVNLQHGHIPNQSYLKYNKTKLITEAVKTKGKRVGYIPGAGDKTMQAISELGFEVDVLAEKDLTEANLKNYDAIVTGVRAYNTNVNLGSYHSILMNYIKDGGNLIVQYNTNSSLGPLENKIAPYTFSIGRKRITEENSPVVFNDEAHPFFNTPNKLNQKDFTGWVQERSIYHAQGFDSTNFIPLLNMKDTGEGWENGSLITAKYGKGQFTYCGLVLFRQLPAGVLGAYKILANLLALNQQ
jgi:LmbE family N-acetylglucosaminyl deacetylase